ncbi:MAG: hypothetical protein AB7U24_02910 [Sulfurimonadaceae bacterium]|jgi:hypothetical protein
MFKSVKAKFIAGLLAAGVLSTNAFASFDTIIPTSLLPDGFWTLAGLVLGVVVSIGGVVIGIKLIRRARG